MKLMPRNERNARLRGLLVPALFCLLALIVFATQFAGAGIGVGHYGWVSSNSLSIMSRATPVNGFVGHARTYLNADGTLDYFYFDRTPVFFSAIVGALISLTDDLILKVWIARQVMLTLFVLSMLFAWLLLRRLGATPLAALAGVALGCSAYWLHFYRELVDFSHPTLLATLLLLYVIARVKLEGRERWRWLTVATLVAVSLGRAPVSWSVLGLWFILESLGILARRGLTPMQRLRAIFAHDATRMLLLGVAWLLLMTGYNIAHEMARRAVPLEQTSVVDSIQRRIPGAGTVLAPSDFVGYAPLVTERLNRWFMPVNEAVTWGVPHWVLLLVIVFVLVFSLRQRPALRIPLLLTAFSGLAWIFGMINVTRYHEFMTMHVLGLALVFWLAVLRPLQRTPVYVFVMLLFGLTLFLRSSLQVEEKNQEDFREYALYTEDYNRIRQLVGTYGQVVYSRHTLHGDIINDAPYVLGFYLGENALTKRVEDAAWAVSSRGEYLAVPTFLPADDREGLLLYYTRTPENRVGFLFALEPAEAETRFLPEDLAPRHSFGGELALGHWALHDSVQVQPCQRVHFESWWQIAAKPEIDYNLQLALTDADGLFVASTDHMLTSEWVRYREPADEWALDARDLQIPCDTPAGEYPLLLIVFDPLSLELSDKLPLIQADGSEGDRWLYLTTLFVS